MKTKMFNKRLFLDMFKQLAPMAVLFIIAMVIASAIQIISRYVETVRWGDYAGYDVVVAMLPGTAGVWIFSVLGVAFMTIFAFRFLNNRTSSDFYHSIPESRISLFNSIYSAVITWAFIGITSATVANLLIYKIFLAKYSYVINYTSIPVGILAFMSMGMVASASFALAASLTGKDLENIILGFMILLTPGLYIISGDSVISEVVPYAGSVNLLDIEHNLALLGIFHFDENVFDQFDMTRLAHAMGEIQNILSTLLVGLIIYTIAVYFFKKHASEEANRWYHGRAKSIVFAVWVACLITLPILPYVIINKFYTTEPLDNFMYFVVMEFVLALVVYLFYLFVVTKDYKFTLKMSYGFIAALIIDAVFLGVSNNVVSDVRAFTPIADEVESVNVAFDNGYYSSVGMTAEITDKEIINILTDALKHQVEVSKNMDDYDLEFKQRVGGEMYDFDVTFKIDGVEEKRTIHLYQEDSQKLMKYIAKNCEEVVPDTVLPEFDEDKMYIDAHAQYKGMYLSDTEDFDAVKLYNCVKKDMENGASVDYLNNLSDHPGYHGPNYVVSITLHYIENNTQKSITLHTYAESAFDETDSYLEECYGKMRPKVVEAIKSLLSNEDRLKNAEEYNAEFGFYVYLDNTESTLHETGARLGYEGLSEIGTDKIIKILDDELNNAPSIDKEYYIDLQFMYYFNDSINANEVYSYTFAIDSIEDIPEEFKPYIKLDDLAVNEAAQSAADTAA